MAHSDTGGLGGLLSLGAPPTGSPDIYAVFCGGVDQAGVARDCSAGWPGRQESRRYSRGEVRAARPEPSICGPKSGDGYRGSGRGLHPCFEATGSPSRAISVAW
jgi:hypothetical protein